MGLEVGGALRFRLEAVFICFVRFIASNLKPLTSNIFSVCCKLLDEKCSMLSQFPNKFVTKDH